MALLGVTRTQVSPIYAEHRCCSSKVERIAHRRWLSIVVVAFLGFSGSFAIGFLVGIPEPAVHDEFSYLLAADTFAHGRLTNPTHPMWVHFESFHIIQQPTYMSKYPPAQGLLLAGGQVIASHPIVGVWLSFAFMCAAITWMLYAWVSPRWALFGGLLAVIHPQLGIAGYWAQSYWGGAVAATGGALLMGSLRRIIRQPRLNHGLVMGLALAMLANSRPYEGLILSLPVAFMLFAWMLGKRGPSIWTSLSRIALPLVAVLAIAATAMAYYNFRVTGTTFRMPYEVYEKTYAIAPSFIWQPPRPDKSMHHQVMRDLASSELNYYDRQDLNMAIGIRILFALLWALRFGDVFLIPLVAMLPVVALWTLRNRWGLFALAAYVFFFLGVCMDTWQNLHYAAPIAALNYFFVVQAMRLWLWRNRKVAQVAFWFIPLLGLVSLVWSLSWTIKREHPLMWFKQRARILDQLQKEKGKQLIIVSYGPDHSSHDEWVYNAADIDHARVVWARSMDVAQNCKLLGYFKDRRVWSLEVNDTEIFDPVNSAFNRFGFPNSNSSIAPNPSLDELTYLLKPYDATSCR